MKRGLRQPWASGVLLCGLALAALAQGARTDLSEYRTTETAIRADPSLLTHRRAMPAFLGVVADEGRRGELRVAEVAQDSPAARAGIAVGDIIASVAGVTVRSYEDLGDLIRQQTPGSVVTVTVRRNGRKSGLHATLSATSRPMDPPTRRRRGASSFDEPPPPDTRPDAPRAGGMFSRPVYMLAVIRVQFPDVRLNDALTSEVWSEALFSTGTFVGKNNPTGQPVFGSLNDYFREVSYGSFSVQGAVLEPVTVSQPRSAYGQGTGARSRTPLLIETLDAVVRRDGSAALDASDGVLFIYAGTRPQTSRGGLYWPHRSSVLYQGKRRPYIIVPEGGSRMTNISVIAHEFGHLLGLPDLYARPESPGSEGAGMWCAMSQQAGNGRPQHLSAWCKERMGWLRPVVLDPRTPQKLVLRPVTSGPTECYKVLVRPDGGEYLLLENRTKSGFDASVPAEGMLIWRVVGNRPLLEESHGIEGPIGPSVLTSSVPYPSGANDAFTPYTIPSSRSHLGGGLPVYITNIQRHDDGSVTFHIGYRYF